jgi:hypothetical protein
MFRKNVTFQLSMIMLVVIVSYAMNVGAPIHAVAFSGCAVARVAPRHTPAFRLHVRCVCVCAQVTYRPYMSALAKADIVADHERLAEKGDPVHVEIKAHVQPVLLTRALNSKKTNRWNPRAGGSLLMRTTGNMFFDYVRVPAAYSLATHCVLEVVVPNLFVDELTCDPCACCAEQRGECAPVLRTSCGHRGCHVHVRPAVR